MYSVARLGLTNLLFVSCAFLIASTSALSQDAMFVDSSGNVGVGTNTPLASLHIVRSNSSSEIRVQDTGSADPLTMFNLVNGGGHPKFRLQDSSQSDVRWEFATIGKQGSNEGFKISKIGSGANNAIFRANGDLEIAGTLSQGSSRSIKYQIASVDHTAVLAKLQSLKLSEWSYIDAPNDRHIGPMAEDFHAIFALGPDNEHIAPSDLASVAISAAKALGKQAQRKAERIEELELQNNRLEKRLERIEAQIDALVGD